MSEAKVSTELLKLLAPLAAQAGIQLPGATDLVPEINLDEQTLKVAEQLGGLLARCGLYCVSNTQVVTIEHGKMVVVTRERFCTLIEEFVTCVKYTQQGPRVVTMGKDMAGKVLECRQFTRRLPALEGIVPVRVPVRRASGAVELLSAGYDEEHKVFCLDEIPFAEDMTVADGMAVMADYWGEFEFAEPTKWIWQNRSYMVQVAGALSSFCRLMLPAGTPRPMFIWVANQQGSGKSVLAEGVLGHVFGPVAMASTPETKEELSKLLDVVAQAYKPYLFIDDAPAFVASGALNSFITRPRHTGRVLGTATEFDVPNVTTVLLTGNNLEITADLMRRSLIVELFVAGDIEKRKFRRSIEPGFWAKKDVRSAMLAACWAIVRRWTESGEPPSTDIKPTFEAWSSMIGGMCAALPGSSVFPLGRPMVRAELPMAGDRRGEEWKTLLVELASAVEFIDEQRVFTTHDIVTAARESKLLEDLVGADGDKDLTAKELRAVGRELRRWRGRVFKDTKGRLFEFGARHQRRGAEYPLRFLDA